MVFGDTKGEGINNRIERNRRLNIEGAKANVAIPGMTSDQIEETYGAYIRNANDIVSGTGKYEHLRRYYSNEVRPDYEHDGLNLAALRQRFLNAQSVLNYATKMYTFITLWVG